MRQDEAAVNIQAQRDAKATLEARLLAEVNAFECATGLQVSRVELAGQTTHDGRALTALVSIEAVLR